MRDKREHKNNFHFRPQVFIFEECRMLFANHVDNHRSGRASAIRSAMRLRILIIIRNVALCSDARRDLSKVSEQDRSNRCLEGEDEDQAFYRIFLIFLENEERGGGSCYRLRFIVES